MTEKVCGTCRAVKAIEDFYRTTDGGRMRVCRPCHIARTRAWEQVNWSTVLERARASRRRDPERAKATYAKYRERHRAIALARTKDWRRRNADKVREYTQAYRVRRPEVARLANQRRAALKRGAVSVEAFTLAQWEDLKAAYGHRCVYCGRRPRALTQDHVVPLSQGGAHALSNIVPACRSCNSRKHAGPPPPYQPVLGGLLLSPRL